jgi:hypothetical protein
MSQIGLSGRKNPEPKRKLLSALPGEINDLNTPEKPLIRFIMIIESSW